MTFLSFMFVTDIGDDEIKVLLAILFTGVPLKKTDGQARIFDNDIYNILQPHYPAALGGRIPAFFLPQKVGIGVVIRKGDSRYFWSTAGGHHAESYMFNDRDVTNHDHPPTHVFINYTPCGNPNKNCYNKFIRTYTQGQCPRISTIWPYLVSPAGVQMRQVEVTKLLINHCGQINPWSNMKAYVDILCKDRAAIRHKVQTQNICTKVTNALKTNAFKQRNKVAKDLFQIISQYTDGTRAAIERQLKQRINKWIKDRYHDPSHRPRLLAV